MIIIVNENTYELETKLGTAIMLEKKFKLPLVEILTKIGQAEIPELISIIQIAANKNNDLEFVNQIKSNWDYTELSTTVQSLLANIMYSGTPEQQEQKLENAQIHPSLKNEMRKLLGLPAVVSDVGVSGEMNN